MSRTQPAPPARGLGGRTGSVLTPEEDEASAALDALMEAVPTISSMCPNDLALADAVALLEEPQASQTPGAPSTSFMLEWITQLTRVGAPISSIGFEAGSGDTTERALRQALSLLPAVPQPIPPLIAQKGGGARACRAAAHAILSLLTALPTPPPKSGPGFSSHPPQNIVIRQRTARTLDDADSSMSGKAPVSHVHSEAITAGATDPTSAIGIWAAAKHVRSSDSKEAPLDLPDAVAGCQMGDRQSRERFMGDLQGTQGTSAIIQCLEMDAEERATRASERLHLMAGDEAAIDKKVERRAIVAVLSFWLDHAPAPHEFTEVGTRRSAWGTENAFLKGRSSLGLMLLRHVVEAAWPEFSTEPLRLLEDFTRSLLDAAAPSEAARNFLASAASRIWTEGLRWYRKAADEVRKGKAVRSKTLIDQPAFEKWLKAEVHSVRTQAINSHSAAAISAGASILPTGGGGTIPAGKIGGKDTATAGAPSPAARTAATRPVAGINVNDKVASWFSEDALKAFCPWHCILGACTKPDCSHHHRAPDDSAAFESWVKAGNGTIRLAIPTRA